MMKKFLACLLMLSVVVAIGACSKEDGDTDSPTRTAPGQRDVPGPTGASGAATAATGAGPMTAEDLVGTVWAYDGMTITFTDDSKLLLKGGVVDDVAPEGLEGTYTLENGIIEVSAHTVGITKSGTFDGTTMVVDGKTAVLMQ